MKPTKPLMPRDMAGSMTFQGGTGGILRMISFDGFLEAYKVDATNRVYTPDHVDPDRTNPNAPWSAAFTSVGCANPIIARMIVQTVDILNMVIRDRTVRTNFLMHMWKLKESLLACEGAAAGIVPKIQAKCDEVQQMRISANIRAWNPMPSVEGLLTSSQAFLNHANRVVRLISAIPNYVIPLRKAHKNFDKLLPELEKLVDASSPSDLLPFVKERQDFIRRIALMRNYEEHDSDGGPKTVIHDFRIRPDGVSLWVPQWGMEGEDLVSIVDEMPHMLDYLLHIAEEMFMRVSIHHALKENMPISVEAVDPPPEDCPIKFRMHYYFAPTDAPFQG